MYCCRHVNSIVGVVVLFAFTQKLKYSVNTLVKDRARVRVREEVTRHTKL